MRGLIINIVILIGFLIALNGELSGQEIVFSPLDRRFELNEDQIRYVSRLPDGRLIVFTESTTSIFNGGGFKNVEIGNKSRLPINQYLGRHVSYIFDNKFWLKNQKRLTAIDITTEHGVVDVRKYLNDLGFPTLIEDFFIDAKKIYGQLLMTSFTFMIAVTNKLEYSYKISRYPKRKRTSYLI